jgi:hypothetical protein
MGKASRHAETVRQGLNQPGIGLVISACDVTQHSRVAPPLFFPVSLLQLPDSVEEAGTILNQNGNINGKAFA